MAWIGARARPRPAGRPGALRLNLRLSSGMRVGLYGGSFNPAHSGHVHVSETARRRLGLDRVIWLVSRQNPLKPAAQARFAARVAGARELVRGRATQVSDAEVRLRSTFTIDTLRLLKARYPAVRFVWIMGADSLAGLAAWRDWSGIFREVPVAVVARPGMTLKSLLAPAPRKFSHARLPGGAGLRLAASRPPAWIYLTAPWNFASSTALRNLPDRAGQS